MAFIVFREFLLAPGTLGHNWDWSISPLSNQLKHTADSSFYVWVTQSLGRPRLLDMLTLPFVFMFSSFGYLGLTGEFVSKFLPFVTVVLAGVTMFYLVKDILDQTLKENNSKDKIVFFSSLLSGYFYALSPFLFCDLIGGAATQFFTYSILPLVIFVFRKMLTSDREKYILVLAILLSLITFALQSFFLISVILLLYLLSKPNRLRNIKKLLKVYILYPFINLYWILPLAVHGTVIGSLVQIYGNINLDVIRYGVPSMLEILVDTGYAGRPIFALSIDPTIKVLWVFSAYGMVIITFLSLFFMGKKTRESMFWVALYLFSILFATGGKSPFGELVLWLFANIFFMNLFRGPQQLMVLTTLSLAILLGISVAYFITYLSKFYSDKKKIVVSALMLIIMVSVWVSPFFTGNLGWDRLNGDNYYQVWSHVNVYQLSPDYVEVLNQLNQEKGDFRVLFLPAAASPLYLQTEYQWFGQGGDPTIGGSSRPVITADGEFTNLLEASFSGNNIPKDASKLLGLANVKYIILRKDVTPIFGPFANVWNYTQVYNNLKKINSIKLIQEYEYVSLWENEDFLPHIYATNELTYIPKGFEDFPSVMNLELPLRNAYFWDATAFNQNQKIFSILYLLNEKDFSYLSSLPLCGFENESDLKNWWVSPNFEPERLSLDSNYVKEGNYSLRTFFNYSLAQGGGNINLKFDSNQNWNDFGKLSLWFYYPEIPPNNANVELILFDYSWNILYRTQANINEKGWNPLTFDLTSQNLDNITFLRFQFYDYSLNFKSMPLYLNDLRLEGPPLIEGDNYTDRVALFLPTNKTIQANISTQESSAHIIGARIYSQKQGTLEIKVDNQALNITIPKAPVNDLMWIWSAPMELNEGNHSIFVTSDVNIVLDKLIIKSFQDNANYPANTTINFEEINPTKYIVHANASKPFFLVFSESYHEDWVAYIDGQQVPNEYHFTANDFANGWYINKTGVFTITLEFWPQNLFYASSAISVTTLFLCILYVSKDKIKIIYQKYIKKQTSD